MMMSKKNLERAEAKTQITRLKKMVKDHEKWCSCEKCVRLSDAEIDYAFNYENYGEYLK